MAKTTRRSLIGTAAMALALGGAARAAEKDEKKKEPDVEPGEDLMREHGVLRRVMFLYDEAAHRLDGSAALPLDALAAAAAMVRKFVEDYHERTEENHV